MKYGVDAVREVCVEKQDISDPEIDWAKLFRHVARDQVTIELGDGEYAIAQIVPVQKSVSTKQFASIMSSLPSFGDDCEAFAQDIETIRESFKEDIDPWAS